MEQSGSLICFPGVCALPCCLLLRLLALGGLRDYGWQVTSALRSSCCSTFSIIFRSVHVILSVHHLLIFLERDFYCIILSLVLVSVEAQNISFPLLKELSGPLCAHMHHASGVLLCANPGKVDGRLLRSLLALLPQQLVPAQSRRLCCFCIL